MYKRSILDYFRVHEPTNAKKNRNESKEEEDVDYFDPERVETTSIISLIQGWNKTSRVTSTLMIVIATVM